MTLLNPAHSPVAQPLLHNLRDATARECYVTAGLWVPRFAWAAALLCSIALLIALLVAPTNPAHGEHYRIIFLHNPATWMSVLIYLAMICLAAVGSIANHRLASMAAVALGPTGAMFAFLALWTGSLWGKPAWGLWWVWDPRLTAELLLLFLFLGFNALQAIIDDPRRADSIGALWLLAGALCLPVLYFAMLRWSGLQEAPALSLSFAPGGVVTVLSGLMVMTFGLCAYTVSVVLVRLRIVILERERGSDWVLHDVGDNA